MNSGYTYSAIRLDWVRISWRLQRLALAHDMALAGLEGVPGVDLRVMSADGFTGHIDLPRSTWKLPAALQLFEVAGCAPPSRAATAVARGIDALYPHQREAVEWLCARGRGLLADDMGLGKTRAAAVALDQLVDVEAPRLIIGPLFVRDTWRRELAALGLLRNDDDFVTLYGLDETKADLGRGRWWFCHFDVVGAWVSRLQFNSRGRPKGVIIDEGHHVRNGRTKRAAATTLVAGTIPHRIVLTGTPIENRPADLWSLLNILDGHKAWGSPAGFRERYCGAQRTDYGLKDGRPTNVDELKTRLADCYMRRTKSEVGLTLPPLTRSSISTRMHATDNAAHSAMLHGFKVDAAKLTQMLINGQLSTETLRMVHELQQITSTAKLGTTAECVANAVEQGASVVVFCQERGTATNLAGRLKALHCPTVRVLTGELSQAQRDAQIAAFQMASGKCKPEVIVATYGVLREGVTLTRASVVVLHDLTWLPSTIRQSEDRLHRISQREPVQSIWSIAEDSIDTIFAKALYAKAQAATQLGVADYADAFERLAENVGVTKPEDDIARLIVGD